MTGYPWQDGDTLFARDLNAAFASGAAIGGPYLATSGGSMLGPLNLNGDPASPLMAATKQYVDAMTGAAGGPFLQLAGGSLAGPGNLTVGGTLGVTGTLSLSGAVIKGPTNGSISFQPGTNTGIFVMQDAANGANGNYLRASNAASGNSPVFRALGPDANVNITYSAQAAGIHVFNSHNATGGHIWAPSFRAQTTMPLSGVQALGQYGFYENMTFSGSISSGQVSANLWGLTDTVDASTATDGALRGFRINHALGAGFKGGRYVFHADLLVSGASANTNPQARQYVAGFMKADANANDGGTSATVNGSSAGGLTAANPMATLSSGATNWNYLTGMEIDISVHTGASVYNKTGLVIVDQDASGAHQGGGVDRAIAVASGYWRNGIQVGGIGGGWPMDTTNGVLFNILPQFYTATPGVAFVRPQTRHGIDLSWLEQSGNAFASMGFSVQKDAMLLGPARISASAGTVSIDVSNKYVVSAVVSGGAGINNVVGDRLYGTDGYGDVYAVASLGAGGAVATVTVVEAGSASGTPSASVTTVGGSGGAQAVVLTRTWATATALSVQPTAGGLLGFYGTAPIAKQTGVAVTVAAVHAALTSLGLIAP